MIPSCGGVQYGSHPSFKQQLQNFWKVSKQSLAIVYEFIIPPALAVFFARTIYEWHELSNWGPCLFWHMYNFESLVYKAHFELRFWVFLFIVVIWKRGVLWYVPSTYNTVLLHTSSGFFRRIYSKLVIILIIYMKCSALLWSSSLNSSVMAQMQRFLTNCDSSFRFIATSLVYILLSCHTAVSSLSSFLYQMQDAIVL